ncbi:MAG TPA: alkaline phosphatase family protein, partial [Arachidicoccus sp.]|nr:alkaline phosphatase family protein [Arachidicoccus sp.]
MDTRREFLKKGALLSGAVGISKILPASIQKALAINPNPGSTFMDAEHVVILMQENRGFDHCFGTLQGVRGFNDPRAITLPDKNKVWLQTNALGQTYAPFRFDIQDTKITWMGSTPHSRSSQVDAYNDGRFDNWLIAKQSRDKKYANIPMTLGHYTREDIPFNYALADAFTICDQHFCSAMTSTNPNRLFFWTGAVREKQNAASNAYIRNLGNWRIEHLKYDTFPERLTKNNISWKFYQNDIDTGGGFTGDERAWLANFGCNPLEWFTNYHVKFASRYTDSLKKQLEKLPAEIKELETKLQQSSDKKSAQLRAALDKKKEVLRTAEQELKYYTPENFEKLSKIEKQLYNSAFTTNQGDPDYHKIGPLNYTDKGQDRTVLVPKGDVLHQFRSDVDNGKLPTVSWLSAAQNFSDHPSAPWYGLLYVSEVLDILTKNPEVWKKTIFIMTYDENDGYFDHVPPFVAPDPLNPASGKCSSSIDTSTEYIHLKDELDQGIPKREARGGPIGLGFRVPLIVASP